MYLLLANLVLGLHVALVFFVVLTVPFVFLGWFLKWRIVRNFYFRLTHLVCMLVVTVQAWFGIVCPLTTLEMWLRKRGNVETYSGNFIEHWMQTLLYWNFPEWVFIVIYTLFVFLIMSTWVFVPPKRAKI